MEDYLDIADLIGAAQDAGLTSVNYAVAWRAAIGRKIPAQRVGRVWRIRRADLPQALAYLRTRVTPSAA